MKSWEFRNLAFALGLLLLVTGGLKIHAAFSDRPLDTHFLASRWEFVVIAEFELFLGGWLIAGLFPHLARCCALMTFFCFLAVSLFTALSGERSCSCFGVLEASPWIAAFIDTAALMALVLCGGRAESSPSAMSPMRRALFTVSALSFPAVPVAFALSGNARSPLLLPANPVVDLGILSAGERRNASLRLTNERGVPVDIERIETSCHCLSLECFPRIVPSSGAVEMNVTLDLGKEPKYVGNLRIHVQGRTRTGALAFSLQVRAKVQESGFSRQYYDAALAP